MRRQRLEHRIERLEIARKAAVENNDYHAATLAVREQNKTLDELIALVREEKNRLRVAALIRTEAKPETRAFFAPEN